MIDFRMYFAQCHHFMAKVPKTISCQHKKMEMNSITSGISLRKAALIAGLSIVAMAILAGFAYGFVIMSLVVPNDAVATAKNIRASEMLFRSASFCFLLVLICDILVAWALYIFFEPINKSLSLLTAWLRLVYAGILGTALLNFAIVLALVNGSSYLGVFEPQQVDAQMMLFINGFNGIWSMGLFVFGCYLLVLGYLAFTSGMVPKILGILLSLAGACYLLTNVANLLWPSYPDYKVTVEMILSLPMIVGELGFGLWLLFKGGKKAA
jgi:Domain of unknown function (DUF4386)